jgi:hypothetical protein
MIHKKLLRPERLRKVPAQFSWLDQRLIRQGRLRECAPPAWALYLFLAAVSDERGLSYYSESSLQRELGLDQSSLQRARQELVQSDLVVYEKPLWQLLSLDPVPEAVLPRGQTRSVGEVLAQLLGGAA